MSAPPTTPPSTDAPDAHATDAPTTDALTAEVAREQEHVDRAYSRVEEQRAVVAARERDSQRDARELDERGVYERDVMVAQAAARRADLDTAGEGLVFGRLDLAEPSIAADGARTLHVGRLGVRTDAQEPLVVDWRAPAAAPFYSATAARPQGVVRRRTISCRGPRVLGVDDDLLDPTAADELEGSVIVGDGAFLAAVGRERSDHMRDIVATIQAEQDAAVRAPDDGALLVTGGPGTGKTAVALHRVAYLMYAKRELYGRRGVLVVGPSPVFVDYVSRVLPSLGETSVRLASLGALAEVPARLRVEGRDEPLVAALKGSARMAELLRRVVRDLATPGGARGVQDLQLTRWGQGFRVPAQELTRQRQAAARGSRSHNASRGQVLAGVVDAAWRAWQRRPQATRVEADDRSEFAAWLRGDPTLTRALDRLWPVLDPVVVLARLRAGEVALDRVAGGLYDEDEQQRLALAWGHAAATDPAVLTPADAAVLDELRDLLGAPPEPEPDEEEPDPLDGLEEPGYAEVTTFADRAVRVRRDPVEEEGYRGYAHLVVDEAQDVSPMQWRALARRGRTATWTVVGDWAQSAWPDAAEVRAGLAAALGRGRVREVELTTNYRTSSEIGTLAARVLAAVDPAARAPLAVRSTGVDPLLMAPTEPLAALPPAVTALLAQVGGTVGVIAPAAALGSVRERLADLLARHPRLSVQDAWGVKGLEYDACVVLSPRELVDEGLTPVAGLRALYVCLTRATQRLTVLGALPDLPVAPMTPR